MGRRHRQRGDCRRRGWLGGILHALDFSADFREIRGFSALRMVQKVSTTFALNAHTLSRL